MRSGETATLTIQAAGGPDEKVQLFATAESPPEWLAQWAWSAGPTAAPRLAIENSPPAGAAPGVREFAVHATASSGFTTQAVAVWRVLALGQRRTAVPIGLPHEGAERWRWAEERNDNLRGA